jgi:hypothetical protein
VAIGVPTVTVHLLARKFRHRCHEPLNSSRWLAAHKKPERHYLWLANCYFAHDSSGFPFPATILRWANLLVLFAIDRLSLHQVFRSFACCKLSVPKRVGRALLPILNRIAQLRTCLKASQSKTAHLT